MWINCINYHIIRLVFFFSLRQSHFWLTYTATAVTWIKHFAIKSRARGLQGILEQINPCTTLLLHRLFSPVSLSASWPQTSLDYTQSHQSCFRCWNEPNTHHLLPLKWLILASPSFPFAPSPALYICRGEKREKPLFLFHFLKIAEQSLLSPLGLWKCAMVTLHTWMDFPHPSWRCSSLFLNIY